MGDVPVFVTYFIYVVAVSVTYFHSIYPILAAFVSACAISEVWVVCMGLPFAFVVWVGAFVEVAGVHVGVFYIVYFFTICCAGLGGCGG